MNLAKDWRTDKWKTALTVLWLLTVASSFFSSTFTLVYLPAIGAIYPFRILLPTTAVLYLMQIIRKKQNPWKGASNVQRICYVLCALLVVCGGISLLRAVDFGFTFRRFFNLCFDLCFFYLALELCRNRNVFVKTIRCAVIMLAIQIPIGIFEVFFGGVFNPIYDTDRRRFHFFEGKYQRPVVASGNTNDFSMMLIFMLALALLYWAWRHREEVCDWIPVALIAPIYFLILAGDARLCGIAFWILVVGFAVYALTLKRSKGWIMILTALLLLFVIFGNSYHELVPAPDKGKDRAAQMTPIRLSAAAEEQGRVVPLSAKRSLKDEMFVVDEETGELRINLKYSAGSRLDLLLHAAKCFVQSNGLGVGLGNTEQLAKVGAENRRDAVWNIHCFLARMTGDFGMFFLIPLLLIVFELLRKSFSALRKSLERKDIGETMLWALYLCALASYPIVSTASSDAQDCLAMWLFLAVIVLFPIHCRREEQQ